MTCGDAGGGASPPGPAGRYPVDTDQMQSADSPVAPASGRGDVRRRVGVLAFGAEQHDDAVAVHADGGAPVG